MVLSADATEWFRLGTVFQALRFGRLLTRLTMAPRPSRCPIHSSGLHRPSEHLFQFRVRVKLRLRYFVYHVLITHGLANVFTLQFVQCQLDLVLIHECRSL